jgi:acyl-CoA thioesterase FadM
VNLWLRVLGVLIGVLFKTRLGYLDESSLRGRVWLTDLDYNIHMNNARYLAVMDLGRFDHVLRTGLMRLFISRRWQPLLGAVSVRFRRALGPFEAFTVHTRFVGWDERRAYYEQWIEAGGSVVCHAITWVAARSRGGRVDPAEIARAMGVETSPPLPNWVKRWRDLDGAMDHLKEAAAPAAQ